MASNGRQRAQSEGPKCDFCNKPQREVRRLIQGPDANHICDGCVEICVDIVKEESSVNVPQKSFQGKPLELLPDELGSTLKKYRAALDALENIKDKLTPVPICQSVVYILFHQKAVVYVGESSCGLGRVYQHTKDKEFDSAYWMEVDRDSRVEIESMLIRVLKPKYNNWGKSDAANEVPPTEMVLGSGPDLPS